MLYKPRWPASFFTRMMSKSHPVLSWILLGLFVIAGAGCSKEAKFERRLAAGDKQMADGYYDVAEAEYRAAMQLSPNDPKVRSRMSTLLYNQGRVLTSYLMVQQLVKDTPEDIDAQLIYGLSSLAMARTADARAAAKKVLEARPTSEEAVLLLVETCITSRDNEETRRMIEELRAKNADTAAYHVGLGMLRLVQRDPAGAETEFRKALELDPKSSAAHAQMGNLHLARNEQKQAAESLKTAADLSPPRAPRRLKYIDFLIRSNALAEAKTELANLEKAAPDYVPALVMAMKLAYRQNELADTERLAAKVLERDRTNYDALLQKAALKLAKGDFDGVLSELKTMAGHYPRAPQLKYQQALVYLKKNEPYLAEENLQQALQLSPSYDDAIMLLADIQLKRGDAGPVIPAITAMLKRTPGALPGYVLLAKAYQLQGNIDETINILKALSDATPNSAETAYLLGMALSTANRKDDARAAFERSLKNKEDYWPALEVIVEEDFLGNRKEAITQRVEAMVAKYPQATAPWLFRAKLREASKDDKGAEADLLKAIELEPGSHYAYVQLARLYFESNRGQEAVTKLTQIATATNTAPAYMQLGTLHSALKQYDLAQQAYEKALAIDARFVPALNNLASVNEKLGQLEKALTYARKARELSPTDVMVADTLGWIHFRRGQYEAALPLLQSSAEAYPGEPDIQYHLAMTHYQLGQERIASQVFERVINASTDSPVKEDARSRLAILAIDPAKATPAVRADLEERLKREPNDPAVLTRLGAIKERNGAPREAAAHYEAALKVTPRSFSTLLALVHLYVGPLKDPAKARELAKSAHTLQPTDGQAAWRFGRLVYEAGDFAWSVTLLEEAARQLRDQPNLTFDLAQAQYSVGRIADAEASVKQALAGQNLTNRAGAQRMATMIAATKTPAALQAALPEARAIIAREPNDFPALMVVALSHEQQKEFPAARQVYEKILAQNAAFAVATRNLAILFADQLGDDAKGEELATKARQTFPEDPELAYSLGTIQYRKGDYNAAVRFLRQSQARRENHPETLFFLGMAQFQLKNGPESRTNLQRALQLKLPPQEEHEARRVLEELNRGG